MAVAPIGQFAVSNEITEWQWRYAHGEVKFYSWIGCSLESQTLMLNTCWTGIGSKHGETKFYSWICCSLELNPCWTGIGAKGGPFSEDAFDTSPISPSLLHCAWRKNDLHWHSSRACHLSCGCIVERKIFSQSGLWLGFCKSFILLGTTKKVSHF